MYEYDCSGAGCLEAEGRKLAAEIRRLGEPVNLVGFSMGGVVVRAAHAADPSLPIQRAAFINAPHGGSWLAHLGAPFKALRGIRQLRPGSDLLRRLAAIDWHIPALAIWSPLDLAVIPGTSARWAGATERVRCNALFHSWPICSRRIHERIVAFFSERNFNRFSS
jgi:pimeloyl-ACP methyl ester carboxylesterase